MIKYLSKHKNGIFSALILLFMALFALSSEKYAAATLRGVKLWAFNILPSVFPYFVFTALLTSLGSAAFLAARATTFTRRAFGCGGMSGYGFFIAALSGYPGGSKITAELYAQNLITYNDAYKMSGFCSLSSPLFIVGTVGGMILKDAAAGFALLGAHLLSVLATAIILRGRYVESERRAPEIKTPDNVIYNAVYDSVISILVLGGIVTVYFVLIEMLSDLGAFALPIRFFTLVFGDPVLAQGFAFGLVECTTGISAAAESSSFFLLPAIGFLISFGGLSVMTQSVVFLKKAKIKTARFFLSKILHAVFTFLFLVIFCLLTRP